MKRNPHQTTLSTEERDRIQKQVRRNGYRFHLASGLPALVRRLNSKDAFRTAGKLIHRLDYKRDSLWLYYEVQVTAKKERFSFIVRGGLLPKGRCLDSYEAVELFLSPINVKRLVTSLAAVVYKNQCEDLWRNDYLCSTLMRAAALGTTPHIAALLVH
jgi:hypothetical protein